MRVFGLTGGSGTGKTTVLRVLSGRGAKIIDCDKLYHKLLEENGPLLAEIHARFPDAFEGGCLNRKQLGNIVFNDETALLDLNAIAHKYVCEAVDALLAQYRAEGENIVAIEAIALVESGLSARCDIVIATVAKKEERVRRIVKREGISEAYAQARINSQKPDKFFEAHSDYVLESKFARKEEFMAHVSTFIEEIWEDGK